MQKERGLTAPLLFHFAFAYIAAGALQHIRIDAVKYRRVVAAKD